MSNGIKYKAIEYFKYNKELQSRVLHIIGLDRCRVSQVLKVFEEVRQLIVTNQHALEDPRKKVHLHV
jgi:hypothetical protein